MRPTTDQLKGLRISPSVFDRLMRWGWVDMTGRAKQWWEHQGFNHDSKFAEARERKEGPKKFVKASAPASR